MRPVIMMMCFLQEVDDFFPRIGTVNHAGTASGTPRLVSIPPSKICYYAWLYPWKLNL